MTEYHGQKTERGKEPKDVPPMPSAFKPNRGVEQHHTFRTAALQGLKADCAEQLEACGSPDSKQTYPHVRMTGNYGANFCQESTSYDYYNITSDEAHTYAWTNFGLCGHTIIYFDGNGNVVAKE